MNILVTGAAGFLAGECARQLGSLGHHVVTTDKRGTVDVTGDLSDEAFCQHLPDVDTVLHSAAVQYVSTDLPLLGRTAYFHRHNIVATRNLASRYAGSQTHFVNVGTSMMYEQSGRDIYDVLSPTRGQGLYSASKIAAQSFVDRMPNPTSCIIPCIIAGDGRAGLFKSLVTSMVKFRAVIYPGNGKHKIHVVHVQDVASLICTVIEKRATGRFNAASTGPLSLSEWVGEIADELRLDGVRTITFPLRPIEMISAAIRYRVLAQEQLLMLRFPHVLSIDEGLALGWTPQHTNAGIVRETARALAEDAR
jgi:nucleoside-diphosphate-sugar epimerase